MTTSQPVTVPETDGALDRLNPVERDLLGLLGRGHTAKSIATLRSVSEAAVNERFRSARRKTGIGSSREIARLIVARENRHDFIDLARSADPAPELPRPDAHRRASHRWRLPMAAAVLLAAAILAQQTAVPLASPDQSVNSARSVFTTDAPRSDWAALAEDVAPGPYLAAVAAEVAARPDWTALADEVAAGRRDPAWSSTTEAGLLTAYRAHPWFAEGADSLQARCSATLCEVTGISPLALDEDLMAELRFLTLTGNALGLDLERTLTRTMTDTAQTVILVTYWRRSTD